MKICVLGSGSQGNSIYIGSEDTNLLIDAGLSCREMEKRLEQLKVSPRDINGILVSHEHSDHVRGVALLSSKFDIPVFANRLTAVKFKESLNNGKAQKIKFRIFLGGNTFQINSLDIRPFSVFHDAMDPVGFVISSKQKSIAIATDLGFPTSLVKERLKDVQAIILESNYDEDMLKRSKRPWSLKQRIMARQGHLSNIGAASLLSEVMHENLQEIFLAHLSQECNSCEIALDAVQEKIKPRGYKVNVRVTYQNQISELVHI